MKYKSKKVAKNDDSSNKLSTYIENPLELDESLDQERVYGSSCQSCGGGCYGCGGCTGCGGCRVTSEMLESKISGNIDQRKN